MGKGSGRNLLLRLRASTVPEIAVRAANCLADILLVAVCGVIAANQITGDDMSPDDSNS
jgi:hypothetical protein